jgi:xylulokinase
MQVGGGALLWLARGFYEGEMAFERLEAEAAAVPPGAEGLLFLPYLRGERAPLWDEAARGAFVGFTDGHTRAHCSRAVFEGVAFAVRDVLERSQAVAGVRPEALRVSGGAARSALWNQIKADVSGLLVQQMAVSDAACLGAALLAGVGVGTFSGPGAATAAMVHPAAVFAPRPAHAQLYDEMFAVWRDLYPALRPLFLRLVGKAQE